MIVMIGSWQHWRMQMAVYSCRPQIWTPGLLWNLEILHIIHGSQPATAAEAAETHPTSAMFDAVHPSSCCEACRPAPTETLGSRQCTGPELVRSNTEIGTAGTKRLAAHGLNEPRTMATARRKPWMSDCTVSKLPSAGARPVSQCPKSKVPQACCQVAKRERRVWSPAIIPNLKGYFSAHNKQDKKRQGASTKFDKPGEVLSCTMDGRTSHNRDGTCSW